ncbi:endonuclease/exonuclease/phosphatase family protein [Nocardioides bigeumensis]|uniref:Endonuclease/exonuclease/phosphatase domain-containing protein n=1 Tax=Nocardioides bigeumensis TaxID=433657 RepID=A0ABN2XNU9_9ACTN
MARNATRHVRTTLGAAAVMLTVLSALTACTSEDPGPPANAAPSAGSSEESDTEESPTPLASGEEMELSVLTYNIEYSGDKTTDAVIKDVGADIVGVLESYDRLPEIAEKTGYPYYNLGLQILSKYPIHEPSGADGLYSLIEVQPGYVVAMFNTHLDYVRYGPRLYLNGMAVEDVLASEDVVRTSSIEVLTPDVQNLIDEGYPVFLTGDLNQPSSLDYTEATLGMREGVDDVIPWTVSEALLATGLRDSFREIHPDPVENPGLTHGNPDFHEGGFGDRIDYLYAGGPATTLTSEMVGEVGGPNVDREYDPWTSDHRAVLSSFDVTPVALRQTLSLDRRLITEGEDLGALYNAPGNDEGTIYVVPEGGAADEAVVSVDVSGESGTTQVDTTTLRPAGYDVVLTDADGEELERNSFWIRSEEDDIALATDKTTYAVGEPIEVTWDDGPANRWDWVGVYEADAADPEKDDYLIWGYTGGHEAGALPPTVFGEMTMGDESQGKPWPLPPGDYRIHYLLADQYSSAGYVDVTVE